MTTQNTNLSKLPKFSVFVLGMRGAGKTVLMSSMYRSLLSYNKMRGYFLRCTDDKCSSELIKLADEVEKIDAPWPDSTQSAIEYNFECAYIPKIRGAPTTLCRFSFIDYPGGWIEGEGAPTFRVRDQAAASDSILVLIDGQKVKDQIDGTNTTRSILN